jgi:hypothetical protein
MCKNCLNCNNFDETNYVFTRCKKLEDDIYYENIIKSEDDEEADIKCPEWGSNSYYLIGVKSNVTDRI